jgi:hypothetical protein
MAKPMRPCPIPRAMGRVRNPTGRADWLAANLIQEAVRRLSNPLVNEVYKVASPEIERVLVGTLGPRTKRGKVIRQYVRLIVSEAAKQGVRVGA